MKPRQLTRSYAIANLEAIPALTDTEISGQEVETSEGDTEPDVPVKRGRPVGPKNKLKGGPAPRKATLADTGADTSLEKPLVEKKIVASRTLPARQKRVVNPGAPDQKRPRRSGIEVKAAADHKEELKKELKEINERKIQAMAEIEAQEEMDDEEEARLRESGVDVTMDGVEDSDLQPIGLEEEDASFVEDDDESEAENVQVFMKAKAPVKKSSRAKKPAKGETRMAVEKATEVITGKNGKKRKDAPLEKNTNAPKKPKAAFPSGLVHNWKSKAKASASKTQKNKPSSNSSLAFGGLGDDDAFSEPPDFSGTKRDLKRSNEFVHISSSDEDEPVTTKSRPKPTASSRKNATAKQSQKKVKGDVQGSSKVKRELSITSSNNEVTAVVSSTTNTEDSSFLPAFARAGWSTRFLTTLNHCLAHALNPWDIGDGVDILVVFQEVLVRAFPGTTYKVRYGDKIYAMAKDRLNDRRALLGRQAVKIVDIFFAQEQYVDKPDAIAMYAKWALRSDGPMVWQTPTPIGCTVNSNDPKYRAPENIFESKFMIDLMTPFVKAFQGSCHDYGHPQGGLSLGAAALKRAFSMYKTGVRIDPSPFSRENTGEAVAYFGVNSQRLSERRWTQIMTSYGINGKGKKLERLETDDRDIDEAHFRSLYIPSSP